MLGSGKVFLSVKMMEIGEMLKRGNQKSQDLGDAIENVARLYINDEVKLESFMRDIGEEEYIRASGKYHVEIYQAAGGRTGKGDLKALDRDEVKEKIGIDVMSMIDGLDPEGFNHFQAFVPFITDASYGKIPLESPEDGPSFPFMLLHIRTICWYILFSIYYDDCLDYLKDKVKTHKWIDPSLN